MILESIVQRDRGDLLARLPDPVETVLPPRMEARYRSSVADRARGLPVAYITGYREFRGLSFMVGPGTLVPRPETELLVEETVDRIQAIHRAGKEVRYHDCCTGSGCVAIAVVRECIARGIMIKPGFSDNDEGTLGWARRNLERLVPENLSWEILSGCWLEPLGRRVDVISANPPYLTEGEAEAALARGWGEPIGALAGGVDGLAAYRALIPQAWRRLNPGGYLLLECGAGQAEQVSALCRETGFTRVTKRRDFAGYDRLVVAGGQVTDG